MPSRFVRCLLAVLCIVTLCEGSVASAQVLPSANPKLDPLVAIAAERTTGTARVIITVAAGSSIAVAEIELLGGQVGRALPLIGAHAAQVPNAALTTLSASPWVARISFDRQVAGVADRTGATVGARQVRQELGLDGTGVGIAVIDSGVTSWHDDLAGTSAQRVVHFVDLVNGRSVPYDDYGHGTHVAGIVAGNGYDSGGARTGMAPGAHLVALKALDGSGRGRISDVIGALGYVVAHKDAWNVRIVNLSIAAGVFESFTTDPLTLAAKRAVDAGLVVVAAAGNFGRDPEGRTQYGGVTAPANAPWVITVGASSHSGTEDRSDDAMAAFSSRGPTYLDHAAKPDLVAPGVGSESLSDPESRFYTTKANALLPGTVETAYLPYLSLSGTSMAAPVVSGTVALMLQANPALRPNEVKAILQYTARSFRRYDRLTQGAGVLNAHGAVALAQSFAGAGSYPQADEWSRHVLWGNWRITGSRLTAVSAAWLADTDWGTPCGEARCSAFLAEASEPRNVVWGTRCEGGNCAERWLLSSVATAYDDTVVWGTDDTVVWGTLDDDTVVWGTSEETVVWGTSDDTVVWGTGDDKDTVVWGTAGNDTVVWGTNEP